MLNNQYIFIWVNVKTKKGKRIQFPAPLPLFVAQEVLSDLSDLLFCIDRILPNKLEKRINEKSSSPVPLSIKGIIGILAIIEELLHSLSRMEPFELVDIHTQEADITIKLK